MKRFATALVLMALMVSAMPLSDMDADGVSTESFRTSGFDLYRYTAVADVSADIDETNVFIYPVGGDASMLKYINDPTHTSLPDKGLDRIERDASYIVYTIAYSEVDRYFRDWTETECVLERYGFQFTVGKDTVDVVTLESISPVLGGNADGVFLRVMNNASDVRYNLDVGMSVKFGYIDSEPYDVSIFAYDSEICLCYDIVIEIKVLNYDTSSIPIIICSVAIVFLIGLLVVYCGRRPKLD